MRSYNEPHQNQLKSTMHFINMNNRTKGITNKAIQYMNIKVLKMAPYYDGILVDRGTNNRVK
ncbi:hypothetical protein MTR_5g083550 [Medicago truncatula]|uniref:Uncharacterized protein n=1 Tax=Medicago truncatula TaxID=3880 RepID=G7K799_MEDTR|nr:hypothetical protein MTR_5g083550 [Medicago truncatula]